MRGHGVVVPGADKINALERPELSGDGRTLPGRKFPFRDFQFAFQLFIGGRWPAGVQSRELLIERGALCLANHCAQRPRVLRIFENHRIFEQVICIGAVHSDGDEITRCILDGEKILERAGKLPGGPAGICLRPGPDGKARQKDCQGRGGRAGARASHFPA